MTPAAVVVMEEMQLLEDDGDDAAGAPVGCW